MSDPTLLRAENIETIPDLEELFDPQESRVSYLVIDPLLEGKRSGSITADLYDRRKPGSLKIKQGGIVAHFLSTMDGYPDRHSDAPDIDRIRRVNEIMKSSSPTDFLPYIFSRFYLIDTGFSGSFTQTEGKEAIGTHRMTRSTSVWIWNDELPNLRNHVLALIESSPTRGLDSFPYELTEKTNECILPALVLALCRDCNEKMPNKNSIAKVFFPLLENYLNQFRKYPSFVRDNRGELGILEGIQMLVDVRLEDMIPEAFRESYYNLMAEYLFDYAYKSALETQRNRSGELTLPSIFPLKNKRLDMDPRFILPLLNAFVRHSSLSNIGAIALETESMILPGQIKTQAEELHEFINQVRVKHQNVLSEDENHEIDRLFQVKVEGNYSGLMRKTSVGIWNQRKRYEAPKRKDRMTPQDQNTLDI